MDKVTSTALPDAGAGTDDVEMAHRTQHEVEQSMGLPASGEPANRTSGPAL